jgi:hypothetical protein
MSQRLTDFPWTQGVSWSHRLSPDPTRGFWNVGFPTKAGVVSPVLWPFRGFLPGAIPSMPNAPSKGMACPAGSRAGRGTGAPETPLLTPLNGHETPGAPKELNLVIDVARATLL